MPPRLPLRPRLWSGSVSQGLGAWTTGDSNGVSMAGRNVRTRANLAHIKVPLVLSLIYFPHHSSHTPEKPPPGCIGREASDAEPGMIVERGCGNHLPDDLSWWRSCGCKQPPCL